MINPVAIGLAGQTEQKEQTEFRGRSVKGPDVSRLNVTSSGTHHVINPSRPSPCFSTASDKSWAWRPGNEAMIP